MSIFVVVHANGHLICRLDVSAILIDVVVVFVCIVGVVGVIDAFQAVIMTVLDPVFITNLVMVPVVDVTGVVEDEEIMVVMIVVEVFAVDIGVVIDAVVSIFIIVYLHCRPCVCDCRILRILVLNPAFFWPFRLVEVYRLTEVIHCSFFKTVYRHFTGLSLCVL